MDVFEKLKEARESLAKAERDKKRQRKELRRQKQAVKQDTERKPTILERIRNFKFSLHVALGMSVAPFVAKADTPDKNADNLERKELSVDPSLTAGIVPFKMEFPKIDIRNFGRQIINDYPEVLDVVIHQRAEARADELLKVYVTEMNNQVDSLQMSKRGSVRHNKQRTKVVNGASGEARRSAAGVPYCLATVQTSFVKLANQYLEFTDLTYKSGGHNGLSCSGFVSYIKEHYPQYVIDTPDITKTMMEKDADGNYKYGAGTLAWQTRKDGKSMSHMISFDGRAEDGTPLYDAGNRDVNDQKHPRGIKGCIIDTRGLLTELAMLYMQDQRESIIVDCLRNDSERLFDVVDNLKQKNPKKFNGLAQKMRALPIKGVLSDNTIDGDNKAKELILTDFMRSAKERQSS